MSIDFENLEKKLIQTYPLGIPRNKLSIATGGLIKGRTMANRDSLGTGIPGRFLFGQQTYYPVDETMKYMMRNIRPAKK